MYEFTKESAQAARKSDAGGGAMLRGQLLYCHPGTTVLQGGAA